MIFMTNLFAIKALRILCCASALTACSGFAGVLNNTLHASDSQAQSFGQHAGAVTSSFDQNFAAAPNYQLASMTASSRNISAASEGVLSMVPKGSSLFPVVGLLAAVFCTQILRRRRAAQLSASHVRI